MKRLPSCLLSIFLLVSLSGLAVDIHVSTSGSDLNDGSRERPLASLSMALRKARELRRLNDPSVAGGIHIILAGGFYFLNEPVFIRPEDSGTSSSPTIIESSGERPAVLSGGNKISNWNKLTTAVSGLRGAALKNVWVADVPGVFRQLWVNGKKAVRAKSMNGELMDRIISWDKKSQSCWIPTQKFPGLPLAKGIEMFIHQWWAIAVLRVKKIEVHGDSTRLFFQQPESRIQSEHPWPAPWISKETGNSPYYLVNAIQFLDEPGEWFLDESRRKLYYWPRPGENMVTATVFAPGLETLVRVGGTIDQPVSNIYFKGISFQHTGWLRPSLEGHVPHQNGLFMIDAYSLKPPGTAAKPGLDNQAWVGRPAAAVELSFAEKIKFESCRFEHLASTGLDINRGTHEAEIEGNLFKDIGGNGLLAGYYSDEAHEVHVPYNPKDERAVCDGLKITNNLLTDVANEDWGCVGIGMGYSRNSRIAFNEVENVSYTGISMGWGWSAAANCMKNNSIINNRVHHYGKHNYDCSGIYTLSSQPGSLIAGNYIDSIFKAPYAHLPSHWFYIYTDEGSSYFTVRDNWSPSEKFLRNSVGPGNEWANNGPSVDESVKQNAGIQVPHRWLLKERTAHTLSWPVNEEHREVIELVGPPGEQFDTTGLKQFLLSQSIDPSSLYSWKNHLVIFDKVTDVAVLQSRLQNAFPGLRVRVYHDRFYQFDRKKHCAEKSTAKEWDHVLLTSNLTGDSKLQQEYLDYHKTQFKKWPEVADGFCNAGFQQLLLFRNGRQLMLVISIPKGKTLDELNPRTTEGNPRMDQWNQLMKKYQQGIEGTKKGETWVFLKRVPG